MVTATHMLTFESLDGLCMTLDTRMEKTDHYIIYRMNAIGVAGMRHAVLYGTHSLNLTRKRLNGELTSTKQTFLRLLRNTTAHRRRKQYGYGKIIIYATEIYLHYTTPTCNLHTSVHLRLLSSLIQPCKHEHY